MPSSLGLFSTAAFGLQVDEYCRRDGRLHRGQDHCVSHGNGEIESGPGEWFLDEQPNRVDRSILEGWRDTGAEPSLSGDRD